MTLEEATAEDLIKELRGRFATAVFCGTKIGDDPDEIYVWVHGSIIHARGIIETVSDQIAEQIHDNADRNDIIQNDNEGQPDDDDLA